MSDMLHYTSCGLRNIWLRNGYAVKQTKYGKAVSIHNVEGLHKAIGLYLVNNKKSLSGSEVRFLRKELDMSQAQLAQVLGVGETTVRGWENSRTKITKPADRMLRVLYREHVDGDGKVRELVERLAELNREAMSSKLELVETNKGWKAAA